MAGRSRAPASTRPERDRLIMWSTAVLFALVAAVHHDDAARLWLGLALVAFLVPLTLVDLRTRLLPNKLTLPAAVVAVALGLLVDEPGETGRLLAGLAAGGFFFVAAVAYPKGMGLGDVKLAAVLGLFLGREVAAALLVALVAGVVGRRAHHGPQGDRGGPQDGRAVRPVPRARRRRRGAAWRGHGRRVPRLVLTRARGAPEPAAGSSTGF